MKLISLVLSSNHLICTENHTGVNLYEKTSKMSIRNGGSKRGSKTPNIFTLGSVTPPTPSSRSSSGQPRSHSRFGRNHFRVLFSIPTPTSSNNVEKGSYHSGIQVVGHMRTTGCFSMSLLKHGRIK